MLHLKGETLRYGVAVIATALASLLYFLSGPVELDSDLHYFGFILAVLAAAFLGGLGPGLLATALSALTCMYLLLPPIYSFEVESHDQVQRLILFGGEGVLLSFVGHIMREADAVDIQTRWGARYLPVVLFVFTAIGLKLLAFRELERTLPFTFFYAAVAASAWIGGFGPGLAATLLSALAAAALFLLPRYSIAVFTPINVERIGLFILEGALIAALSGTNLYTRRLADRAIEQVRQYSHRMRRSIENVRALRLTANDLIWELDPIGNRVILGATEVERPETPTATMSLKSWLERIHPEDRAMVAASLNSALKARGNEWVCEHRKLRPGGIAHVLERAYIIRDSAGNPVRVVGRSEKIS